MRAAEACAVEAATGEVSGPDVARIETWLRAVGAAALRVEDPGVGYVVVTPLGAPVRMWLRAALADAGVALLGRRPVPSWSAVSTALYVRSADPAALARAVRLERAWEAVFPCGAAEAWAIDPGNLPLLDAVKHAIRAELPHVRVALGASQRGAVLHPFHVADPCDRGEEARRLVAAVSLVTLAPAPAVLAPALAG